MRPVLFYLPEALGGAAIPSYGVMMLLAVLTGCGIAAWIGRARGFSFARTFELGAEACLFAILASKLAGLIVGPTGNLGLWSSFVHAVGIWYVGLIAGVAYVAWRGRALGMTSIGVLDIAIPGVALGHVLGRIGCLLAGCCWGSPTSVPWAITFTSAEAHRVTGTPIGVAIHPTQIYDAVAELMIGTLLLWMMVRRRERFVGQAMLMYLIAYAISRGLIETVRDDPRGALGMLSTSQAIALASLLVSVPLFVVGWRRAGRRAREEAAP